MCQPGASERARCQVPSARLRVPDARCKVPSRQNEQVIDVPSVRSRRQGTKKIVWFGKVFSPYPVGLPAGGRS